MASGLSPNSVQVLTPFQLFLVSYGLGELVFILYHLSPFLGRPLYEEGIWLLLILPAGSAMAGAIGMMISLRCTKLWVFPLAVLASSGLAGVVTVSLGSVVPFLFVIAIFLFIPCIYLSSVGVLVFVSNLFLPSLTRYAWILAFVLFCITIGLLVRVEYIHGNPDVVILSNLFGLVFSLLSAIVNLILIFKLCTKGGYPLRCAGEFEGDPGRILGVPGVPGSSGGSG